MKLLMKCLLSGCTLLLLTAQVVCAQGTQMISNTNQPVAGFINSAESVRAVFIPGFDAGGYELTGFSFQLGDNSSVSHGPMHVLLIGSNDPFNLDQYLSDFDVVVPSAPGSYYFDWPTNVYISPQFSYYPLYYYHLLLVPTSGDEVNVAYTVSTNYTYNYAWSFYPEASAIDSGGNGFCPLVNIYATVLPPPKLQPIYLRDAAVLSDGSFQFGFTNAPNFSFSVYFTTNLSVPYTEWLYAGPAENIASNYFQFNTGTDVNHNPAFPRIFFRVSSP